MPATVFGLPTHALVVHFVVVCVPLAVVGTIALAASSRVRDRFGWFVLAIDTLALVSVPVATSSGEALRARVPDTQLIARHAELADQLLPFVAVLWATAVAIFFLHRHADRVAASGPGTARRTPRWLRPTLITVTVLAMVVAVASAVQVVRIGDAGARATWHGRVSTNPLPGQSG